MSRRILHVVTNVAHFADSSERTDLWLSELTHFSDIIAAKGCEQKLASRKGGVSSLQPSSLKWPNADAVAKRRLADSALINLFAKAASPHAIDAKDFGTYLTGGHTVRYDYPKDAGPPRLTRDIHQHQVCNRIIGG